jgi:hypothetical protein
MSDYRALVDRLIAWAALFHGAQTVQDLADISLRTLLRQTGLLEASNAVPVAHAADEAIAALEVGSVFQEFITSLDDRRRAVALRRIFADTPEILENLGAEFGVSRERARQWEADAKRAFKERAGARFLSTAILLRSTLPMVLAPSAFNELLGRLVDHVPPDMRRAAEVALIQHIGYEIVADQWVSGEFRQLVSEMCECVMTYTDPHGIVDEDALREALRRPDDSIWEVLTKAADLERVQGVLVLHDTRRVRLAVALGWLARPATKEELAELTGLGVRSLAAALSSSDAFIRVTKDGWGLAGWTDDPYDGVVGEIVQRIEQGGGRASITELLNDIPTRFGVSPATVQAYFGTPKFVVEDDEIRIADLSTIETTPLSQVRGVVWTPEGIPALRLTVEEQQLRGYSIKVPPAVVNQLGVGPGTERLLPVREPHGCQSVSVIWRAHDPNGPELGRLREALMALGAIVGADVFVVLDPDGLIVTRDETRFDATSPAAPEETALRRREQLRTITSPALERMKSRRRF